MRVEFIHFLRNPSHFDSGISVKVDLETFRSNFIFDSNKPEQDTDVSQTLTPIQLFET